MAAATEIGTGTLLTLGAMTPLASAGVIGVMTAAAATDHKGKGFFIFKGGWEYVGVVGATAAAISALGPGRYSLDGARGKTPGRPPVGPCSPRRSAWGRRWACWSASRAGSEVSELTGDGVPPLRVDRPRRPARRAPTVDSVREPTGVVGDPGVPAASQVRGVLVDAQSWATVTVKIDASGREDRVGPATGVPGGLSRIRPTVGSVGVDRSPLVAGCGGSPGRRVGRTVRR